MKQMRIFALLPILLVLLAGCGGGGGGLQTRKITIQVRWSTTGRKASRGAQGPPPARYFTVEAFDGTKLLGTVRMDSVSGTNFAPMTVPIKDLTFYAHAYADNGQPAGSTPPDINYVTDPSTGMLLNTTTGKLLSPTDVHPVSQAVTVVTIPPPPTPETVTFTMNNTIASIQPIPAKTTYAVDAGSQPLNATVEALSVDGANIMLDSAALTWTGGNFVASLDPTKTMLVPQVTGTAQFVVTDSEESQFGTQAAIQATITITITPSTTQQTLTLNTGATSKNLLKSLPLYAKSITLTLTQNAPAGAVDDSQPQPAPAGPFAVTPVFTGTAITGVNVAPSAITFTPTGRTVTLKVQAWSQANGTGAILAAAPPLTLNPVSATLDPTLTDHVTGFVLTPPSPTITLVNPNASATGFNVTQLQAYAIIDGVIPTSAETQNSQMIDVRALKVSVGSLVTTSFVVTTDVNGNVIPSIQVVPVSSPTTGTTTLTVTDQFGSVGSTNITLVYGSGGTGLKIN